MDFAFFRIDEEHFSRTKTTFFANVGCLEFQNTCFRSHYQQIVVCDKVAGRTKTVSVQHTASIATIGEHKVGRTVPWFHKHAVIFVERFQIFRNRVLFVPTFRHKHRKCVWQRQACHHQKFEHVVERSTIAHVRLNDREQIFQITEFVGFKHAFAGSHPDSITFYGIDFTVVSQQTERLSQVPRWERVGTKT